MTYCKYCGASLLKDAIYCRGCGVNIKNLKKKRWLPFLVIGLLVIIIWAYYPSNDCNLPVKYSIGKVDSRFNLTRDEIANISKDASNRWNNAFGKNILAYDENAALKIDLVYDERQANLDKLRSELSSLNFADMSIGSAKDRLENMISDYEYDLDQYNSDVDYWNSLGGAPSWEYNRLRNEKWDLDDRRTDLIRAANLLDSRIENFNNDMVKLRNELAQNQDKVEIQGLYKQEENKIDIYTFGDNEELRFVLMHELGHALGGEHTNNSSSIMYYLIDQQDFANPAPKQDDLDSINNKCHIK